MKKSIITPTPEQQAVVQAACSGKDISAEALAGTGKTTALGLVADALPDSGKYIAFNKAIVADAKKRFPKTVDCRTAHSLAFQAVGANYKHRLFGARMSRRDVATWLSCAPFMATTRYGTRQIDAQVVAGLAMQAVNRFCHSADLELDSRHVPAVSLVSEAGEGRQALAAAILPLARRIWEDILRIDGELPFGHDHYLKIWQLGEPVINADFILFDESQDADPVMLTVVNDQDAQLIYCGDRYQAIYEWRGAINALERVHVDNKVWLTRSFRFGQAVADEANDFLRRLKADKPLVGDPNIHSKVEPVADPDAVLCRTNGGVVGHVMGALEAGRKPAVVGGTRVLVDFAKACGQLIDGGRTGHPELAPFANWEEVLRWVEEEPDDAAAIGTMVRLVEGYGVAPLVEALEACVTEKHSDVVVSTAHKAKGREWPTVLIADDFLHRDDMDVEDLRLAYVAVTRARESLDLTDWALVPPRQDSPKAAKPSAPHPAPRRRRRPKRPPIV